MLTRKEIAPFETADGYIKTIRYRPSSSKPFQELKPPQASVYVAVDDIRSIPRHEFEVELDDAALPKTYKGESKRLQLIVVCRDPLLKREQILVKEPVDALPSSFILDDKKLRQIGSTKEFTIDISVCAVSTIRSDDWPRRRASRLTTWRIELVNHKKGPRFPWVRKTADEFKAKGLPPNTTFYVNLLDAPDVLLTVPDGLIEDALEVWVHEDAWIVLQQSEGSAQIAAMQRLFITQVTAQLLSLAVKPLTQGITMVPRSLMQQLLEHIGNRSGAKPEQLKQNLMSGATELDPYLAAAYGLNAALRGAIE